MLRNEDSKIRGIFNKRPRISQRALVLVFLSIVLLLVDSRGYVSKNIRYALQAIVAPLQYTVNFPFTLLNKTVDAFASHSMLLRENQRLEKEIILLKLQQQSFLNLQKENQELKTLLHAATELSIKVDVAEVLFVAANTHPSEWMINKGAHDGVFVGQAVLDANGILGQVVMVGPGTSRVMLISDVRSAIPVDSVHTGLRSILQGEGVLHPLSLMFIPKTEMVEVGDILVSSGVGDRFPKGYPVGKIVAVNNVAGDQFLSISVEPLAQLQRQRFVLLVGDAHA